MPQLDQSGLPLEETRQLARKMYLGLDRFIEAQDKWNTYQTALEEVKAGKKKTHWIWFIFPQMRGLGTSEKSRYYGISGRDEAIEYINHPEIGQLKSQKRSIIMRNQFTRYLETM